MCLFSFPIDPDSHSEWHMNERNGFFLMWEVPVVGVLFGVGTYTKHNAAEV